MDENDLSKCIVTAAIRIHRELGPGLLESVYELVLAHELKSSGLRVSRQVAIPIQYRGLTFGEGFRIDLVVEDKVIVELKCVDSLNSVHRKQLLTYLRLSGLKLGLLLNFSCLLMRDGVVRIVNDLPENPGPSE